MSQLNWNERGRLDEAREIVTCSAILLAHRALLLSGCTHPTQYYIRHYNSQINARSKAKSNIRIHRQSQLAALLVTVASCVTLPCPTRQHRLHKSRARLWPVQGKVRASTDAQLPRMMIPSSLVSNHTERDGQSFGGCKCSPYE
jgi:hypothetical protein